VVEDVIRAPGLPAAHHPPSHLDPPLRERDLFADLMAQVPPCRREGGGDELGADVAFREGGLVGHFPRSGVLGPASEGALHDKRMQNYDRLRNLSKHSFQRHEEKETDVAMAMKLSASRSRSLDTTRV